jgi:hypothetical protein
MPFSRGARAKALKSKRYYTERAAYLRRLANQAQTEALRKTCLKETEECEALARDAEKAETDQD